MGKSIRACCIVCLPLLWTLPLAAQQAHETRAAQKPGDTPPSWFVGVSVLSTTRPPGEQDYHFSTPGLGGTTIGVAASFGIFLTPRWSVGLDLSRPGTLTGPFNFDHFERVYATATHNETLVGPTVRWHPMTGRLRLEPLAVVTFAFETVDLTGRAEYSNSLVPLVKVTSLPDVSGSIRHVGYGGGVDVVAEITKNVSVTFSARVSHYAGRWGIPNTDTPGLVGLGKWTNQIGAGLRFTSR